MKLSTIHPASLTRGALVLLLAGGAALAARAEERVLSFADPSKPGKLVIQMGLGDLRVSGADVKDVTLRSEDDFGGDAEPREDGLRRLDSGGDTHAINASGNVITISCGALLGGRHGESTDLDLTVPKGVYLIVQRSGPGDTQIEALSGDIEIRSLVGDIALGDLSGGLVVESTHGDVSAEFAAFPADRPVSISTAHGDVEVRVPEASKAKVRFRTLRGEVLTDFAKEQLVTKMEQSDTFVIESTGGDAETLRNERERVRAEAQRARDEARQAERAAREAAEQAKRAAKEASTSGVADGMVPPIPPIPPLPPLPPLAGGKVVAGTLNGGGPDLSITALMGDIVFRKAAR
ncbi:MAG: DUF4097 family beta strand repeat protein [Opitutaceae bacterium]|nr:DUF4097 family beta strand repeat protein [Opitutaceae bacterium]